MKTLYRLFIYKIVFFFILSNSHADELGRLFTSPQERSALDSKSGVLLKNKNASAPQIKLNGSVISSKGKKSLWVNGKKHINTPNKPQLYMTEAMQVKINTPHGPDDSVIKPGQVLNLDDGKIYESFALDETPYSEDKVRESIK